MEGTHVSPNDTPDDNASIENISTGSPDTIGNTSTCSGTINNAAADNTATTNNTDTASTPANARSETSDRRLQRISDYLQEALAKASSLEAVVGAMNADLLLIAYRMRQALEEALQQGPATIADLEELERTLEQYIKITKQIDRFTQAAMKLADKPPPQNSTLPEVPPESQAERRRSEESAF